MTESHHAVCPLCTRIVSKNDEDELADVVKYHNDARHNGEVVAEIVTADDLDDFMDRVKARHGPEVYGELGAHIVEADPWGVL